MGKTVAEMLNGRPQPLGAMETLLWGYFRRAQARMEYQRKQGMS